MPRYSASRKKSCLSCSRRRIKCSREQPCSYCAKMQLQCTYMPRGGPNTTPLAVLEPHGHTLTTAHETQIDDIVEAKPQGRNNDMEGSRKDDPTAIVNSAHGHPQSQRESGAKDTPPLESGLQVPTYPCLLLGNIPVTTKLQALHPRDERLWLIWQVFTERICPSVNIFHVPSIQEKIFNASKDLGSVDASTESLAFSLYYTAVTSLSMEECLDKLKEPKMKLLERYRCALEQALTRANFLCVPSVLTLQALVLFLTRAKSSPAHQIPTRALLSIAIYLARTLDLHSKWVPGTLMRNKEVFSDCENDIAQRIWGHVVDLDTQMARKDGIDPIIPINIARFKT